MSNRAKSILHEISNYIPPKNKEDLIESRANHIISSAIFLIEMIDDTYDEEEADQLKKRLLSSIKGRDPKRFLRSIRKIKESKHE